MARKLHKLKSLKTLERTAGAWTDLNHPELKTIEDVKKWVESLRHYPKPKIKLGKP